MEVLSRKRLRSDESPLKMQNKMLINEKIVNSSDDHKMKQVHDKTLELLFSAARCLKSQNKSVAVPLNQQVVLNGSGIVETRAALAENFLKDKKAQKAVCCERKAFITGNCINCQTALCEHCGYSCAECFQFLCNRCVNLFDCGTTERPICPNCEFFA